MRTRTRLAAVIAIASLATCSVITLDGCKGQNYQIGPSTGEVVGVLVGAGAVIGVTTAVLIHENHTHHNVKGCVDSGPNGLEMQADDKKTYLLTGNTANVSPGSLVRLHGSKVKQPRHSTAEPSFKVEKIGKDYGPCKVIPKASAANPGPAKPEKEESPKAE